MSRIEEVAKRLRILADAAHTEVRAHGYMLSMSEIALIDEAAEMLESYASHQEDRP